LGFSPVQAGAALPEGGARILQFRHKGFWSREVFAQAEEIAALCRDAPASFIVNDRADYAGLLHAGLHLGQDDLPPPMRAAESEPVDYVAFGPVFTTGSKERPYPTVGIEGLRTVRSLTPKPLVAIGGITRGNASMCWSAGADSVAVIADLLPSPCTQRTKRDWMAEWLRL